MTIIPMSTNTALNDLSLLRVMQLASPTLPVGAYAQSQGLEWAVEAGWVNSEAALEDWLIMQLRDSLALLDLPVLARLHAAALTLDDAQLQCWSRYLLASRETRELVADDCERGKSLARLLSDLGVAAATPWVQRADTPFAALSAIAAVDWQIPAPAAASAYAWGWLENQVLAGVKLIPLGQLAGQRLLLKLSPEIPPACAQALLLSDDDIGGSLPILALASSLHETQYTRLFRS